MEKQCPITKGTIFVNEINHFVIFMKLTYADARESYYPRASEIYHMSVPNCLGTNLNMTDTF